MNAATFDTLGYFESLTAAGVEETQAKAYIAVIRSAISTNDESARSQLATKGDLADVKHEILKWFFGMLLAQTGVIVALYAIMR